MSWKYFPSEDVFRVQCDYVKCTTYIRATAPSTEFLRTELVNRGWYFMESGKTYCCTQCFAFGSAPYTPTTLPRMK